MSEPDETMRDPRELWDQHFSDMQHGRANWLYDPWLERWQGELPVGSRVLDLGCGNGDDTRFLRAAGLRVTAADFSFQALRLVQKEQGPLELVQLDLRQGIPLARGSLDGVVANLCLHYFSWPLTLDLLAQIHGLLRPGGLLLARFNSTHDANFGAEQNAPIEAHVFRVRGMLRRYFDEADLHTLFGAPWRLISLEEKTIARYQSPKVLWEAAVRKDELAVRAEQPSARR
jgi:SAM-dependent methyltransferase